MLNIRSWNAWSGAVLVACAALAGCAPKTDVSTTGDVPATYSHMFLSVQEIRFNTSSIAGPDDTTWIRFQLNTPITMDLAADVDGAISQIITGLAVPAGTYAKIRLIPVDSGAPLLASANAAGAIFNSEVDYTDAAGNHRVPLELQNPDKGIGIDTTVTVKRDNNGVFAGAADVATTTAATTTTTDPTTGLTTTTTPTTTTDPATGLTTTTTPTTTGLTTGSPSTTVTPFSLAINVDGSRDLVPFAYIGVGNVTVNGVLLNPHVTAYDESAAGTITGTVVLSSLTGIDSDSTDNYVNVQITAESLSADGTRHVAVNSAPVSTTGAFTLFPLTTSSSTPASYDLVIHGPQMQTMIIKNVTVNVGAPSSSGSVSIGTVTAIPATPFTVNLVTATPLQAGALVGFYQTLPGSGEVPYLIEERPIDPFNRNFSADQSISGGAINSGAFASGADVAFAAATPTEGASTYRVSATAPLFTDGVLTTMISAPAASSTIAQPVAVPALTIVSGAVSTSASMNMSETAPGRYNKGELIISHDGAIVATAALDAILAQGGLGTVTLSGLPGGTASSPFASGLYYISVRTWNSNNSAIPLNREIYPNPLDLRSGSIAGFGVNID